MQIKIFTIPTLDSDIYVDEMNHFLRAHRVVDIKKEFLVRDGGAWWTFCVTYILGAAPPAGYERKEKVDYKQVLDETAFTRFSKLREIRRKIAADDAVPAYSVFTDAELAEFAKTDILTPAALKKVEGVGEKRLEKYGEKLAELYEAQRQSDSGSGGQREPAESLFEGL